MGGGVQDTLVLASKAFKRLKASGGIPACSQMSVPFETHQSTSLAKAILKACPRLEVLNLDIRSCHVPSLLKALADEGHQLGMLVRKPLVP
mgnify:CR=1 FL=1